MAWLPDGVFVQAKDGTLAFHQLPPPDDADVDKLLVRVAQRVLSRFDTDTDVDVDVDDDDAAVAAAAAQSLHMPGLTPMPLPELAQPGTVP